MMRSFCVLAVLCSLLAILPACSSKKESNEIIIGFNPAESADTTEVKGKVLAKLIEEKTGLKLKTYVASDFGSLVEAMRSGRVHMAFLPGFSYVQAEKVAGAKVLLKVVRKGSSVYYPAIITAKGYKTIQDLKGKTIAWTDPSSASGHIMAKNALMDLGIDPETYFAKQVFAGGHDALALSVLNKTVDAGATLSNDAEGKDGLWTHMLKDPEKSKQITVVFVGKAVPSDTFSTTEAYYSTHKEAVDKITAMLVSLKDSPEGKQVLSDLYHIDAMLPATKEEYQPLRDAAIRLKIEHLK